MNYEDAAEKLLQVRSALDEMEREHKAKKAKLKEREIALENWFTAKAQEDGLESIKTRVGTAYWSTHSSATVASREELFAYCRAHDAWDLIESRASKTAVRSHIEEHGEVPPGVNFNSIRKFNFRRSND